MKRLIDMIKQIPLVAGFLAIVGLGSYLVMMILRSVVKYIGLDFTSSEKRIVVGMLISAAVCFVLCYFALRRYLERLGENDVRFLRKEGVKKEDMKPSLWYAFLFCGASLCAYGAVLLLLNFYHWNFFEGPIFYLSFAFYAIPETLYADTTVAFVFVWCEFLSFVIFSLLYLPAMLRGYVNGFRKEKEKE